MNRVGYTEITFLVWEEVINTRARRVGCLDSSCVDDGGESGMTLPPPNPKERHRLFGNPVYPITTVLHLYVAGVPFLVWEPID